MINHGVCAAAQRARQQAVAFVHAVGAFVVGQGLGELLAGAVAEVFYFAADCFAVLFGGGQLLAQDVYDGAAVLFVDDAGGIQLRQELFQRALSAGGVDDFADTV